MVYFCVLLTINPASVRLAESLDVDNDVEAREALASLVKGCCSDVLFRSEAASDHHLINTSEDSGQSVPVGLRWCTEDGHKKIHAPCPAFTQSYVFLCRLGLSALKDLAPTHHRSVCIWSPTFG